MIRINKIFIKNFKGIPRPVTVDFSQKELTILDGPNGFGKTTIFDTIEICLRSRLERTNSYDHVTKKNTDHLKPFYQNKKGEDVVLKIWLRDNLNNQDHIIIKYLNKDHDGREGSSRAFRPDAWGILTTYYTQDVASFDTKEDVDGYISIEQSFIDKLIFGSKHLSLINIYPLFNYLQQEENIYFLKKDEEKKKNELDFLFQTQQEARNLEKINDFLKNIRSCKQEINSKLSSLGEILQTNKDAIYKELFPGKKLAMDIERPFQGLTPDNIVPAYERFRSELEEIDSFIQNFDVIEFQKFRLKEALSAFLNRENLLYAHILQRFMPDGEYQKIKSLKDRYDRYISIREKVNNESVSDTDIFSLGLDQAFADNMNDVLSRKRLIEGQIGELGKIIVDLNASREKVMNNNSELYALSKESSNCPLCDTKFSNVAELLKAVQEKTVLLTSFNENQVTLLESINNEYQKSIAEVLIKKIDDYINNPEHIIDDDFYNRINAALGVRDATIRLNKLLSDNNLNLSSFIITTKINADDLKSLRESLMDNLRTLIENLVVNEEKIANQRFYKDLFGEDAAAYSGFDKRDMERKRLYLNEAFMDAKFTSAAVLQQRILEFEKIEKDVVEVQKCLDKAIKKYKMDMIEKIKIPFYIFSGKILQNYQQGHGIFIDMNERTNRVRFLTDKNSDHDIVHHLSSGQLAVVSIAFCLALNKVYNTNNNFKFLAIDDPVQTLDDVNVHSFIELMRHDFKDYQILLSTHEEKVASYMDYKFQKFGFNSGRKNVQSIFYNNTI